MKETVNAKLVDAEKKTIGFVTVPTGTKAIYVFDAVYIWHEFADFIEKPNGYYEPLEVYRAEQVHFL